MQFTKFDATNSAQVRQGKPTICFGKRGQILLSKELCRAANLKNGDLVSVIQDDDEPGYWYLVVGDKDGFRLIEKDQKGYMIFNSAYLVANFIKTFDPDAESLNCIVSTDVADIDYSCLPKRCRAYAIITSSAKQVR